MENYGILINPEYFAKLSSEYHRELDKLTAKIHRLAGTDFNINSPSQLAEVLFDKLQIKGRRKKSPSGKFSTKISVLEELEEDNPIIKEAFANIGQRPYGKSGSVRKKRSHIVLKAMSKSQKNSIKKKVAKSEEVKK